MPYSVTINNGLKDVVLPNGVRYQGGAVVTLSDAEYAQMSAHAVATLFGNVGDLGSVPQVLATLPSAAYTSAQSPLAISTSTVDSLAVDISVTAVTGGTTPTAQFILERQGADTNWYSIFSSTAANAPFVLTVDVGPFSLQFGGSNTAAHAVLTSAARLRWVYTGAPTSYTFSVSVIGR